MFLLVSYKTMAAQDTRFVCGGSVEEEIWQTWDTNIRDFLDKRQLQDRLLKQGDVYALYDFQAYTHNAVSMARRCSRTGRLMEVARLIRVTYGTLEPGTPFSTGRQWVCRGGSICNEKNRLLNQEVMLSSVQFLGLASSVANALVTSATPLDDEGRAFVRDTVQVAVEHLLRWGDDAALLTLRKATTATPQDVKNSSSALFFTDKPLWLIPIYSELAGIMQEQESRDQALVRIAKDDKVRLRRHLGALLQFFSARISFQRNANSRLGNVDLTDIDRGYRRLYVDNHYAGYETDLKPVECVPLKGDRTRFSMEIRVPADKVPQRQDTGWDISHARRLVHTLDALERNRNAMKCVYSLDDTQLPPTGLPAAFANTLVAVVWNGDKNNPLFANYWSGANGWYRVAYDNGTGRCREGYPPYGLTDSFPTGGYITWARYNPTIGLLGQRLYDLSNSSDGADLSFMIKYYPALSRTANTQSKVLSKIMFLPSMVGVIRK